MKESDLKGAVIEIGTNSVKFLTGCVKGCNKIEVFRYNREITRSGEGLNKTGKMSDNAMERTLDTLKRFHNIAKENQIPKTIAFGTHSLRTAKNADVFIKRVKEETGIDVVVLTGQEEAFMTHTGVLLNYQKDSGKEPVIIDIGGGSTEIIHGSWANSLPVGCVNLTEEIIGDDEPCDEDLVRISSRVRDLLLSRVTFLNPGQKNEFVGVGGTVNSVAALSLGLKEFDPDKMQGFVIEADDLRNQILKLSSMTLDERRKLMRFDPKRADVIVAGMVILNTFFRYFSIETFKVSIFNIIHSMFYDCFCRENFLRCEK